MTTARDIGTATGAFEADLSETEVNDAISRARAHLYFRQAPAGWWKGELRTNVTMDAEDLLLRQFLGILQPDDLEHAARWIRSQQRRRRHLGQLRRRSGRSVHHDRGLRRAAAGRRRTRRAASGRRSRVHPRRAAASRRAGCSPAIWLALFGEWSWDDLPAMPPELVLLPSWVPLNVYDWACWARQTVVPITVVATLRPVRPLPFSVSELRTGAAPAGRPGLVAGGFGLLDKALKAYHHAPVQPGRSWAMRQAAEWIVARQESDGGWGGIQPPWVYSILALHLMGYSLDHPVLAAAIDGLDGFLVHEPTADGPIRRLEACQSPVWDTCLAVIALARRRCNGRRRRPASGRRLAAGRRDRRARRLVGAPPERGTGRLGVRVRERRLPRRRRHRRGGAGALARSRRCARGASGHPAWGRLGRRHAIARRRLGRVRRRQHQCTRREAAVLRLRRGDRSAVGRRHGTRRRDARTVRRGERAARAARRPLAARRPGDRRFLVRAMGRQLRLRHRCRGARAGRRGHRTGRRTDPAGRRLARAASERRRRLG